MTEFLPLGERLRLEFSYFARVPVVNQDMRLGRAAVTPTYRTDAHDPVSDLVLWRSAFVDYGARYVHPKTVIAETE